jgi:arabinose-5-phosphate isomerase
MITGMIEHSEKIQALALTVLDIEADAILALKERIDDQFLKACEYLLACQGRIVVIGMGKSGHIASKLAATLASTGTPAFFVHPGEASHGDIGMITPKDVVLILSNSGETDEILTIAPVIKRLGIPLITLTGNPTSSLAQLATINIDVSVKKEACPLGLAPTSSTTASLAMGDALAIALLQARGFTADDFARSHPGGILGRRLLLHIEDVMRKGDQIPQVSDSQSISEALLEMTAKNLGMTTIINHEKKLVGIYTDGDLRRTLDKGIDIHQTPISSVMTKNPKTLTPYLLAIEGIKMMENYQITGIVVTNEENKIIGILHMHDLLKSGVL